MVWSKRPRSSTRLIIYLDGKLTISASIVQGIQILASLPDSHPDLILPSEVPRLEGVVGLSVMSADHKRWWRNFIVKQFEDDFGAIYYEDFFLEKRQPAHSDEESMEEEQPRRERLMNCTRHPSPHLLDPGTLIAVFAVVGEQAGHWIAKVLELRPTDRRAVVQAFVYDNRTNVLRLGRIPSIVDIASILLSGFTLTNGNKMRKQVERKISLLVEDFNGPSSLPSVQDESSQEGQDLGQQDQSSQDGRQDESSRADDRQQNGSSQEEGQELGQEQESSQEESQDECRQNPRINGWSVLPQRPRSIKDSHIIFLFHRGWARGRVQRFIIDDDYYICFSDGTFALTLSPAAYGQTHGVGAWACLQNE